MKWLGFLLLTGALTLLAIWAVPYLPGYVLVRIGDWTLETGVVWLLLAILLVYLLIQGGVWLWRLPGNAVRKYLERRSRAQLELGMLALAEGQWGKAEKALKKSAERSRTPAVSYIAAAQAAHGPGADSRRAEYLEKAEQSGEARESVLITKAQLLLAEDRATDALALLKKLPNPRSRPRALDLLAQAYEQLGNWSELAVLAPDLVRHRIVDSGQAERIAERGIHERLATAADFASLKQVWNTLPKTRRKETRIVAHFAAAAIDMGHGGEVEAETRGAIRRQWDEHLVELYGRIDADGAPARLKHAERWLADHPGSAALHLTLGRLCLQNELWGKAREHLDKSLALAPTPIAYELLGRLHERLEDPEAAVRAYRRALEVLNQTPQS